MTKTSRNGAPMGHTEREIIRLALEFVIANRNTVALQLNDEYRSLADVCEKEYSRRVRARRMGEAVRQA